MDLFYFLVISLVVYIFFRWRQYRLDQEINELAEKIVAVYIPLSIEKINDSVYAWHSVSNEFICQGRTYEEWKQNWMKRWPGRAAVVDDKDHAMLKEIWGVEKVFDR